MTIHFLRGDVLTPKGLLADHVLEVSAGRIARIVPASESRKLIAKHSAQHLKSGMLVPGFLDLQVNPVGNCDLAKGGMDAIPLLAKRLARTGCTGFLCHLRVVSAGLGKLKM